MVQIVYLDRLDDPGAKTVSTMGSQPGPVGGDGWSVVAELPTARLQSGRHYAFWVTGRIGNIRRSGAAPVSGLIQLCLGDSSGVRSPFQLVEIGAADNLDGEESIPFAFLLIFSSAPVVVDPAWGPVWPNVEPLGLYGRTYWRNDVPAYVVEFDVVDLAWVWADLDAIPLADQLVTVQTTPVALGAAPWTNIAGSINTAGQPLENWVHFFSLNYKPGVGAVPNFQIGTSTALGLAFFYVKHGTGRWGMGHRGTAVAGVQHHHGSFWFEQNGGPVALPSCRGYDRAVGAAATVVQRVAFLSLRLDNLPGFYGSQTPYAANLTDDIGGLFIGTRRWPLELIGGDRSVTPWVFATGTVDRIGAAERTLRLWVDTDGGELPVLSLAGEHTTGANEAIPSHGSGANGIGPTSPSIQYRARWLETSFGGVNHHVRDIFLLTFFPVRDPDNEPPIITPGARTGIAVGTESLAPGSLAAPPLAPDVAIGETVNWERQEVRGATGHVRTWGVFVRPRRSFVLSWGPVTAAQRDALLAFFVANLAWKITPLREAAIAVVPVGPARWSQESAQTFRVDIDVAELVYTG